MANPLKLEVLLGAVDKATAPLNRVSQSSKAAAARLGELREQQRQVNRVQKDVEGYRKTREALRENEAALAKVNASLKGHKDRLDTAREAQKSATRVAKSAERDYQRLAEQVLNGRSANQALNTELEKARIRLTMFRQQSNKAAGETARYARLVRSAEGEEKKLSGSTERLSRDVGIYSDKLKKAGVDTNTLGFTALGLKRREDALTASITRQREQLDRLGQKQEQVNKARERYQHGMQFRNNTAITGVTGMGVAAGTYRMLHAPIEEAQNYEVETARVNGQGLGHEATQRALQYVKDHQAYGVSGLDSLTLLRDARSIYADQDEAESIMPMLQKAFFANRALYSDMAPEEIERNLQNAIRITELRGGANDPKEFARQLNMQQQVVNATGGRVDSTQILDFVKKSGVYGKGFDNAALYYTMEPLIQEMGGFTAGQSAMSLYQNLYQGKTTKVAASKLTDLGLIADPSKIKFDKVDQQAFIGPGNLKGGDLFKRNPVEWVEKILLPQLAENGITKQSDILDAIGSIVTNRNGANFLANIVQQLPRIQKNAKLNAKADDVDQMHDSALKTTRGKEIEAEARRADLYRQMGTDLMPLYNKALEKIAATIKTITEWMEKNPRAAKAMLTAFAGFGAIAGVLGGVALATASIIGPIVTIDFLFRRMGIAAQGTGKSVGILGRSFGWLAAPIKLAGRAIRALPKALLLISRGIWLVARAAVGLAVANPVIAAIVVAVAALGAAAYLIYQHWGAISQFFKDRWKDVEDAFHGGIGKVSELLVNWSPQGLVYKGISALLSYLGVDVPSNLFDAGKAMINGLWDGMKSMWEKVAGWFDGVGNWIKEKMPFSGHWEVTPPAVPINKDAPWAKQTPWKSETPQKPSKLTPERQGAMKVAAKTAMWTGATMPAFAGAALPSVNDPASIIQMDTRPPVIAPAAAPANHDNRQYSITIHAAPGMDERAVARHVSDEIDRRDRQKKARERSLMTDRR
ncbi:hypothetical protein R84981_001135 [Carnimonas sp. R-84981]|uniref:hypothetical protein n=1 Tax=Carnimonas bestiolae TaxID=3402172 RepID=UPI003EDC92E6